MSTRRLQALGDLAQLVHDHELARTARLARARDATAEQIARLSAPRPAPDDPAMFQVRQAHLAWASGQRMRLNQTLARQTADLIEQRRRTARSLGRIEALSRLREKQKKLS
jgi:hypothetical protein